MLTRIGNVEVWRILESIEAFMNPQEFFPDMGEDGLALMRKVVPRQLCPHTGKILLPIQGFIIKTPRHVILVDVVVDENRTDIRFHPRSMQGYATVELKRETWSVRELEQALTGQLVGQYLQHDNCRAGCLLICQAKAKRWRHPDTNAWMSLKEVVDHLTAIAREVMAARPELHIAVKGIDYSEA